MSNTRATIIVLSPVVFVVLFFTAILLLITVASHFIPSLWELTGIPIRLRLWVEICAGILIGAIILRVILDPFYQAGPKTAEEQE